MSQLLPVVNSTCALAIEDEHDVSGKQDEVYNTLENRRFSSAKCDDAGKKGER